MWLKELDSTWTLFLDRDGVINERDFSGYITNPKDFHFTNQCLDAIKIFSSIFKNIIIVTNQQGVGKGLMATEELNEVHSFMLEQINSYQGKISKILSATNLKGAINDRRKPLPHMALEAKELFPEIDFSKSIMVGDTNSDILFGKRLGMKTVLFKSKEIVTEKADIEITNLHEFALKLTL